MKIILSLLFSLTSFVCLGQERVIIRASVDPTAILKKFSEVTTVTKFSHIDDEYFKQLYTVELKAGVVLTSELEHKFLSESVIQKVERTNPVEVYSVYPDQQSQIFLGESLTRYQWGLFNQGQKIRREVDENNSEIFQATNGFDIDFIQSESDREVVVAVLDTGIDFHHPELKNKILLNSIECNQIGPRVDRDLNKYPADCMGWNFTVPINSPESNNVMDVDGHGTHVASIMAASLNQKGMAGLSNSIKVLPIKVLSSRMSSQAATDRLALGVLYAIERGVDVINFSMGWSKSMDTEYLQNAIQLAIRKNIAIVAAAGNNSSNDSIFPCAYPNVICVGAISANGTIANFSNYGGMVDVLAPGELILSAIPTTMLPDFFSMKGFDFKSGTSQASPFVAGTAALIKQKFPHIQMNEIAARLYESTRPVPVDKIRQKHVQHGLISLKNALTMDERISIKPTFKMMEQVLFRARDQRFAFKLPIKNFWKEAKDVKVIVNINNTQITLDQSEFLIDSMSTNQVKHIEVSGKLNSLDMDNRFDFSVQITSSEGDHGQYRHDAVIARYIDDDREIKSRPVRFRDGIKPIALIQQNKMAPLIKLVADRHMSAQSNYYYLLKQEEKALRVHLFKLEQKELMEQANDLVIPHAKKILNFMIGYFNNDDKPDILVRSIAEDEAGEHVLYSYFNLDGSELFPQDSHWRFMPDVVLEDFQNMVLISHKHKKHGMVKVPYFTAFSKLTDNDQATGYWHRRDDSVRKHIYYLEPQFIDNKTKLITRTLTTKKIRVNLRSRLKLNRTQEVKIEDFVFQKQNQLIQGSAQVTVSSGVGFNKKLWSITVNSSSEMDHIESIEKNKHNVDTKTANPVYSLIDQNIFQNQYQNTAWVGFASKSMSTVVLKDEDKFHTTIDFNQSDKTDHLLGFLSAFSNNEDEFYFYQSRSSIVMFERTSNGEIKEQKRAAVRFSFLPGFMFNQLYSPATVVMNQQTRPALLVDGSEISAQHMEVITLDDQNKLIAPIKYSIRPPANCKSLGRNMSELEFEISLLCFDRNVGFTIRSLSL